MKKISSAAVKQSRNISQQKLTIALLSLNTEPLPNPASPWFCCSRSTSSTAIDLEPSPAFHLTLPRLAITITFTAGKALGKPHSLVRDWTGCDEVSFTTTLPCASKFSCKTQNLTRSSRLGTCLTSEPRPRCCGKPDLSVSIIR
jgi:hypothetical protein